MPEDKVKIAVWPDGTWCMLGDVEQMAHMSDDYAIANVPIELAEDPDFENELWDVINQIISFKKGA